ncbi:hypothetical protein SUGI_0494990 [Cryptomeria japonica]|uniref:methyltransferase FGSG_00040-like n=1 Tax=Cryptomeria japonica TaxID=3369 RepID=UPI002408ABD1|nr:methyltransferase FGSG_00040-like [Cryptomeria japonica]GLJ25837.1 hypothetical protein SUGI_0494990 [Cryptomeria japonica]
MSRRNSLRRVQAVEPLDFEEERSRGKKCFSKEDWSGAVAHYTNCARFKKKNDESATNDLVAAYSNRAEALLQMGEFNLALRDCTKGLELDPKNLKTLYRKGRALHALKEFSQAFFVLEEALEIHPEHSEVLTALQQCKASYAQARMGEYDVSEFLHGRQPPPRVDDVIGDVEIRKTKDGRGWGLYATKNVGAGELLLVSNAVAVARRHAEFAAADKMLACLHEDLVRAVIDAADKSHVFAQQLCALDDGSAQGRALTPDMGLFQPGRRRSVAVQEFDGARIRDIVARNALSREVMTVGSSEVLCGLWLLPSFINHSCIPSSGRLTVGNAMFLHAAKDINKGEEITMCYSDALLPLPLRQAKFEACGFKCICRRCSVEKSLYSVLKPLYSQFEALHDKAVGETNWARASGREFLTELPKCAEFGEVFLKLEQILAKQSRMKDEEKKWIRSSFVSAYLAGIQSEEFFPKTLEDPFPARVEIMQAIQSTVPGDVRTLVMAAHELKEMKGLAGASEQWAVEHSAILASQACIKVFGNHRDDVIQELISSYSNCHVF